jgi:hypothetical protein
MSFATPTSEFTEERPEVQSSRVLAPTQLSQFEVDSMKQDQRRLTYFSDEANIQNEQKQEDELFINLSLVTLCRNLSATIIAMINDLLAINQNTRLNDIILIFVKGDRLVYLGILMVMIALSIYIVDITT